MHILRLYVVMKVNVKLITVILIFLLILCLREVFI